MKDNNIIDELFKQGTSQEYPYDETLWAAVEEKLPFASPKRSFWNFNLNSIALAIVLFAYAFIPSDTGKTSEVFAQSINAEDNGEQQNGNDINKQTIASSNTASTSMSAVTDPKRPNPKASLALLSKKEEVVPKEEIPLTAAVKTSQIEKISTKSSIAKPIDNLDLNAIPSNSNVNAIAVKENKSNKIFESNEAPFRKEVAKELYSERNHFLQNDALTFEPQLMTSSGYFIGTSAPLQEARKIDNKKILPKKRQYYIELLASRSLKLSKTTKSTKDEFVELKNNSETSLHATNFGVNVLTHYKFLTFGMGIHINTFLENVDYGINREENSFDISYDTSYTIINKGFNSGGNTVLLIEEEITENRSPKTIIVENSIRAQNEFKRIRIPLSIGYEKSFGSWSAGLNTSFVINYLYKQKGYYIDETLTTIYDLNDGEEFYLLAFGHQVGAAIGYSLNEYIAVGAKLFYEYDLNSFTKDFDSKFQSQNLGFWVRIRPK